MAATTYTVEVKYMLDDKASKSMAGIGKKADQASKSVNALSSTIKRLAIGAAGFLSFRLGKKLLIDYNARLQESVITMTTLIHHNLGGFWAQNQKKANMLVQQFTKDAARGVGTTEDYLELAKEITGPFLQAGGAMEDLTTLTKGAVTAAKAFGIAGDVAGRDIQQALMGTLRSVDRLPKLLGINAEQWNKMFREKGPQHAAQELIRVFNSPAIRHAAETYGKSWDGITSTLEDNLQRAFGKIGLPLMQAITKELEKLNAWFEANPEKVNQIVESISKALVTGFNTVKSAMQMIARHKDIILAIAKAWLAFKGVGLAAGLLKKPFDAIVGLGTAAGKASSGLVGFAGKLSGILGKVGLVGGAFGIGVEIGNYVVEKMKQHEEKTIAQEAKGEALTREAAGIVKGGPRAGVRARGLVRAMQGMGLVTPEGHLVSRKEAMFKIGMDYSTREHFRNLEQAFKIGRAAQAAAVLESGFSMLDDIQEGIGVLAARGSVAGGDLWVADKGDKGVSKPKVNVNINRIEVVSDDPDRFAFNLVGALQDFNTNATHAKRNLTQTK